MHLSEQFDGVIILAGSDWKNGPRGIDCEYAIRFAREIPVLFLQRDYGTRDSIFIEPSGVEHIDLLRVSSAISDVEIEQIRKLLSQRGVKRPLCWFYYAKGCQPLIDGLPHAFRAYHAPETSPSRVTAWDPVSEALPDALQALVQRVDFMIAGRAAIGDSYVASGQFKAAYAVVEDGFNLAPFLAVSGKPPESVAGHRPVALFSGSIDQQVDYVLLLDIAQRMPDWEFRFCGNVKANAAWSALLQQPNVVYLGEEAPEQVAAHMHEATVGIIPAVHSEGASNSFQRVAYEYLACGLPVVSVAIDGLNLDSQLFSIASSGEEFGNAIRAAREARSVDSLIQRRRAAAQEHSYETRFAHASQHLLTASAAALQAPKKLRICLLYDSVDAIQSSVAVEHLSAFDKYSRHEITYIPATSEFWADAEQNDQLLDLSVFDAVAVHYSIKLSAANHFDEGVARALSRFSGLKVLFIQNEFEGADVARNWMQRICFGLVYTCVPPESVAAVYPPSQFPSTEFRSTLAGYVPESSSLDVKSKPLNQRKVWIAYRGTSISALAGALGHEKYRIGAEMKVISRVRGLPVDIEVEGRKPIRGDAWYAFLGAARSILGVENGASVFDFDGGLAKEVETLRADNPNIAFKEISSRLFASREGLVPMNYVPAEIFEAIRLRTALILFDGQYSGVIQADKHYIPLRKDFSNVDEVLAKLADDDYVTALTQRAYDDVVASQRYSYRTFVEGIDRDIESRIYRVRRAPPLFAALFTLKDDNTLSPALPLLGKGLWSGLHPLGRPAAVSVIASRMPSKSILTEGARPRWVRMLIRVWHLVPTGIRKRLSPRLRALTGQD